MRQYRIEKVGQWMISMMVLEGRSQLSQILFYFIILLFMLVDPRPYTYQFRKPRYSNPTFQSRNLYESLYHRLPNVSNDYFQPSTHQLYASSHKPQLSPEPQQYRQLERNLSDLRTNNRNEDVQYLRNTKQDTQYLRNPNEQTNNPQERENPERRIDNYKLPSINPNIERARAESNIGNQVMARRPDPIARKNEPQRKEGFQRFRIYERQQKPFNIISCYPKENESNKLRNFPKLTLEDKLIERGSYHSFNQNIF